MIRFKNFYRYNLCFSCFDKLLDLSNFIYPDCRLLIQNKQKARILKKIILRMMIKYCSISSFKIQPSDWSEKCTNPHITLSTYFNICEGPRYQPIRSSSVENVNQSELIKICS